MDVVICDNKRKLGCRAAAAAAVAIREALQARGRATVVLPAGASQLEVLNSLVHAPRIDWHRVTAFHLDEYVGMAESHAASFRRFVRQRIIERLPQPLAAFHAIDAEADPAAECRRLADLILRSPPDLALVGIGENGHLAFNDPPADFEANAPYHVVELDEACRGQQVGEGWFASLDEVPRRAISMSVRQILRSGAIICSVPDRRKAEAVRAALEVPITPRVPASILQQHSRATIYLEPDSASLLSEAPLVGASTSDGWDCGT